MEIRLYSSSDETNKIDKTLTNEIVLNGTLKDETSVINPIILIEANNLTQYNYCYIPLFKRYYFIKDITVVRNNLFRLFLDIDVLMSYKDEILNLDCIVNKQENNSTPYINDNSRIYENRNFTSIINFRNGFDDDGNFILMTAGGIK